jgi:hypothetical protein
MLRKATKKKPALGESKGAITSSEEQTIFRKVAEGKSPSLFA